MFEAERLDHQSLRNDRDVMAISGAPTVRRNVGSRKYVGLGKTTSELEDAGNYGQGRMAYETRVNQRKQNVAMRRRAKYLARSRRMGRQPRKYRSIASRSNDDRFGAGNLETLFGPP